MTPPRPRPKPIWQLSAKRRHRKRLAPSTPPTATPANEPEPTSWVDLEAKRRRELSERTARLRSERLGRRSG